MRFTHFSVADWTDFGPVFTTKIGTPIDPSRNARNAFDRMLARADVPTRTPDGRGRGLHELRRTFTTVLRDQGVPLEDVQRLGRWSSPATLLEFYAAVDEKRLRAAAGRASLRLRQGAYRELMGAIRRTAMHTRQREAAAKRLRTAFYTPL